MKAKDTKAYLHAKAPKELITVAPDVSVRKALELIRHNSVHHLVVVRDGECLGVVESRDLVQEVDAGNWFGTSRPVTVGEIMRLGVPVIDEDTDVKTALSFMLERGLTAIPYKSGGKLAGILTETDMLRLVGKFFEGRDRAEQVKERGEALAANPLLQRVVKALADAGI